MQTFPDDESIGTPPRLAGEFSRPPIGCTTRTNTTRWCCRCGTSPGAVSAVVQRPPGQGHFRSARTVEILVERPPVRYVPGEIGRISRQGDRLTMNRRCSSGSPRSGGRAVARHNGPRRLARRKAFHHRPNTRPRGVGAQTPKEERPSPRNRAHDSEEDCGSRSEPTTKPR